MDKKNFKSTLNLPKTSFSMKANLKELEPRILNYWNKIEIYKKLREKNKNRPKFILHDGPPYANGLIHIGHALNKILKDIIVKFEFMNGRDVPFVCGWDCHGLPVEHQLFKELNLTKHDVDVVEFRRKAHEFALKFVNLQKKDFIRLGVFSDWENPYLTLDPTYEYWVTNLLGYLTQKGYIYRGLKPVNWCINCETALAEAEVEYQDKESDSIYVLFEVVDSKSRFPSLPSGKNVYFLIWTTTPWTLISNVAVALHPNLDYVLVELEDTIYVLGKDLLSSLENKIGKKLNVLKVFKGENLENITLHHPFISRKVPTVLADFVSNQEGTGCVHIAPGHGEEDFSLVKKYNLEVLMPVDEKGIFRGVDSYFDGKSIDEVNELVIDKLKKEKKLFYQEKIIHSYPHCWRCKKPIIFRATYQWFLNVEQDRLRERCLESIKEVKWIPPSGFERMKAMLSLRPDWCLSRQRLWGVPIPAIRCRRCQTVILNEDVIFTAAQIFKKSGSDSWFKEEISNFLPPDFKCSCGSKDFQKEFDILDVWFESGASFLSVLKNHTDLEFPADLYLEGNDQHRGWFQVSLIPSIAKEGIPPFKTILTHGFVVDAQGRKMSKSLGNVISPQEIINSYGAEILRLWAAYSDYTEEVKISSQIIEQLVDIYRKIRNTIRFILGNLYDFTFQQNTVAYCDLLEVDRYILAKSLSFYKEVITYYKEFAFYKVCQVIFNFCNLDLSSFYLDIVKDRLYTYATNSKERRSAQSVLYRILKMLIKSIAPILSFTAEESFLAFDGWEQKKESIFLHDFDEELKENVEEELLQKWEKILSLRDKVLKEMEIQREKGIIGSSLEASIELSFSEEDYEFFKPYEDVLREVFIVSYVNVLKGTPYIKVKKAEGKKCLRCWNYRKEVGENEEFPELCSKCISVVKEKGK